MAAGIRLLRQGVLRGEGFEESDFKLYEACSPGQEDEEPYLVVWLHGMDMGDIPPSDLATMQRHLRCRAFFLVPMSPKACGGYRYSWGLRCSKAQNRSGLGFVFGEFHVPFLEALSGAVRRCSAEIGAARVLALGYSMGGFGAVQLGAFAPELFDAVISVAGYGLGTTEPESSGFGAPQPRSAEVFDLFLRRQVRRLARVPLVLVVHAEADAVSSFRDAVEMAEAVNDFGGRALLLEVPPEAADSDPGRKRKKTPLGHHYFNYALLHETSEGVVWGRLRRALRTLERRAELLEPRQ